MHLGITTKYMHLGITTKNMHFIAFLYCWLEAEPLPLAVLFFFFGLPGCVAETCCLPFLFLVFEDGAGAVAVTAAGAACGGCTDLPWLEDGAVAAAACGGCTWLEDGAVAGAACGGCTDLLWLEDGAVPAAACGGYTDLPWLEDGAVAAASCGGCTEVVALGTFSGGAGFCPVVPSDAGGSLHVDLLCPLCLHLLHFIPHLALFI